MRYRALSVVVALVAVVVMPVGRAAADPVVPHCPQGTTEARGGQCVNPDGSTASGGAVQPVTPRPPAYPSSVLAAASGGDTSDIGTNVSIINANNSAVDFTKASSIAQAGQVAVGGLSLGLSLGKGISQLTCNWGIKAECYPEKAASYTPNGDVGPSTSSGWIGGTADTTTGQSTPCWNAGPIRSICPHFDSEAYGDTNRTNIAAGLGVSFTASGTASSQGYQVTLFLGIDCQKNDPNSSIYGTNEFSMTTPNTTADGGFTFSGSQMNGPQNVNMCRPSPSTGGLWDIRVLGVGYSPNSGTGVNVGRTQGTNQWRPASSTYMAIYYPAGAPQRPADTPQNPQRWWVTSSTCPNGNTANSASSATFTETDATFPWYPDAPACSSGSPTKITVTEYGVGVPSKVVWTWTSPPAYTAFAQNYGGGTNSAGQPAPDCTPNADAKCQLGLWKLPAPPINCYTANDTCDGWFTDPNKSSDYDCTYGINAATVYDHSQSVPLSECTVLAPTFNVQAQAKGQPLGNPVTGQPSSGTQGGGAGSDDGSGDSSGDPSCYPSGWSAFNPVEWIVKPLVCLLKFLFIPSASDFAGIGDGLSGSFHSSSLGTWGSALVGVGQLGSVASNDCSGMTLHIPDMGPIGGAHDYSAFSTCGQPWSTISGVVRAFVTLAIAWATVMGCYRIIGSAFGLNLPEKS